MKWQIQSLQIFTKNKSIMDLVNVYQLNKAIKYMN